RSACSSRSIERRRFVFAWARRCRCVSYSSGTSASTPCSFRSRPPTKTSTRPTSSSASAACTRVWRHGRSTGTPTRTGQKSERPPSIESTCPVIPRGSGRDEEPDPVGDVFGPPETPQRDPFDEAPLTFLAVALPLLFGRRIGPNESRGDAIHRDPERPKLVRHLTREPDLSGLGAGVGLNP